MFARLLHFTCLRFVVDSTMNIILTPHVFEQLEAFEQFGALAILAVKLTKIAWFSAISPSILNQFSWNFAKAIFYSNPNSGKNFAKLYSIFQKLDHLTCNKILELV